MACLALKTPPAVRDERLGGTVAFDGGVEDGKVGGEVLGSGHGARKDRPRVVVQHGDDVRPAPDLVVVRVTDVRAPELVPPARREEHLPLLLGRTFRLLQAVELAVEGEDAPAGPGAQVYADLREGGVNPELPEVRVLLKAPDRLHGL